jgi:antitoxin (DNA-binding transcriptional repressor) of toxin-antitoxin stability system
MKGVEMTTLTVAEARARFSEVLHDVDTTGEVYVIADGRSQRPLAKIAPIQEADSSHNAQDLFDEVAEKDIAVFNQAFGAWEDHTETGEQHEESLRSAQRLAWTRQKEEELLQSSLIAAMRAELSEKLRQESALVMADEADVAEAQEILAEMSEIRAW